MLSAMRFRARSISVTVTLTFCPGFTISEGSFTKLLLIGNSFGAPRWGRGLFIVAARSGSVTGARGRVASRCRHHVVTGNNKGLVKSLTFASDPCYGDIRQEGIQFFVSGYIQRRRVGGDRFRFLRLLSRHGLWFEAGISCYPCPYQGYTL